MPPRQAPRKTRTKATPRTHHGALRASVAGEMGPRFRGDDVPGSARV